ncbi:MAG: outer membrane protein assembly factor BamB family protein, partial [Planctomycetota bacterium]
MPSGKMRIAVTLLCAAVFASASTAGAGDWPQWRCDAGRRAYTPDALPAKLHLKWVRLFPEPKAAWPWNQYKQQFDASYEPIVKGKLIFVPSMVRDWVTAYDTETGQEKWRFYADGPVRFAPVAYKDKLLFASDDGCLYCLKAASGKLLWKFPGAPLDKRVLANGRLCSMYPARGAPVVRDGKVYFAAGIWPFLGTFIHALDAETGRVIWSNSGSGAIYILQPHAAPSFAGVAPQGYLIATAAHLLVPGGRAVPAGYDRKTGAFLWHHANTKRGHYTVWATDKLFWNDGLVGLVADGRPRGGSGAYIITDKAQIGLESGRLVGRALALPGRRGKQAVPPAALWQVDTAGAMDRIFIAAGTRVYGSKEGTVAAVDIAGGGVSWRAKIEGKVWNMLAADDKLFVVTREGRIYCFGGKRATGATLDYCRPVPPAVRHDEWRAKTARMLKAVGVEEGHCVVLGMETGRLVEELLRQSKLHLIVLEPDESRAAAGRRRLDDLGLYGRRVHILPGHLESVDMPPYLASLMVSEWAAGAAGEEVIRRAFDVLRPYGGTLCLFQDGASAAAFKRRVEALKLPNAEVVSADGVTRLVRAGALPGSADWSHQYHDMSNNVFSPDNNVKAPLGMLWFGGPSNMDVLPRHGHGPSPQVAAGRLVIQGIGVLSARDVYTGRVIWRREFAELNTFGMYYNGSYRPSPYDRTYNQGHIPGANWYGSNYVTTADKVYLVSQSVCHVLDAATGETVADFTLPAQDGQGPPNWG